MKVDNIQGRGIIENKKNYFECQYYLSFDAQKEFERIRQIKEFIENINDQYPNIWVRRIPEMPGRATYDYIASNFELSKLESYEIPFGIKFDNYELFTLKLQDNPIVGIVGNSNSGRSQAVKSALSYIALKRNKNPVNIFILDDEEKSLAEYASHFRYSSSALDAETFLDEVYEIVESRHKGVQDGLISLNNEPMIIIIINSQEAMVQMTKDKEHLDKYKTMVTTMKNMKISFIFTNVNNAQIVFGACETLKQLRDNKNIIVFENLKDIKIVDILPSVSREYKKTLEFGDAYYIHGNNVTKLRAMI